MKGTRHVRTILGLAMTAAFASAHAQEAADAAALKRPDSAVALGGGISSGSPRDRSIWGQYNGLRENDANLLLDIDFVRRDDATGTWTTLRGRNLGLDSRDITFGYQKQGDWRIGLDYSELVHHEIRTINTGMQGAGSTTPGAVLIAPGAGQDLNFELKRKAIGLAGDKWINSGLQFEVAFRNEDKDGTRMWGRGYDCAANVCTGTQNAANTRWAVLMIPEPVNFNMKSVDAKLNFVGEKLFVSAGYYGSFFGNEFGNVTPSVPNQLRGPTGLTATLNPANAAGVNPAGGTSLQNVLQLPMALPPDNQAHQAYLSGNYAWTPTTRSNFKLAYTHATQNQDYGSAGFTGLPAVSRTNLGGVLDTSLAQVGLTTQPINRLTLLGNVRYERKDDKTPIDLYNVEGAARWNNYHTSNSKLGAKVEGSYLFQSNVRATAGFDYEKIDRELPDAATVTIAGLSGLRADTEEKTFRAELRKSISETLTGSLGGSHSERTGSGWYSLANIPAQGVVYGGIYGFDQIFQRTGTFPYNLADRDRDKARATADWMPTERLQLQFVAEGARDSYNPPSENGLRKGKADLLSVDGSYAMSERWKVTAYGSYGVQSMNEADKANYIADTKNTSTAFGLGINGQPSGVLEVGAGVSYIRDVTQYTLSADLAATPPPAATVVQQNAVGLPDTKFSETRYGVFARYALTKQSDIRFDLQYIIEKLDEWSWGSNGVPWVYSDGTTVSINPDQRVTFGAIRYIYKF